jgi:hypothetical protein
MKLLNAIVIVAALIVGAGAATAQDAPPVSTKKVEGTDNVYIFRYGGHQSMFVVTSQGVIATDPISYLRPAKPYIDAIKAVTDKPIKSSSTASPLRSHRRRQAVQGSRRRLHRAPARQGASARIEEAERAVARHRDARPGGR